MDDLTKRNKIFVNGTKGFIGNALSEELLSLNRSVIKLDRNRSFNEQVGDSQHNREIENRVLVLCDWKNVNRERNSIDSQIENAERWASLGKSAVQHGFTRIIALGSQAEIGTNQEGVSSHVSFQPRNAYGHAKLQAFNSLQRAVEGTDTQLVWARLFSVYGPGMSQTSLIISVIASLVQGREIELSEGKQKWNYLYVKDCVNALISILETGNVESFYNVASATAHEVRKVTLCIANEIGNRELLKFGAKPYAIDEVFDMSPDISNLVKTGWREIVDLESGLTSTITHFREGFAKN